MALIPILNICVSSVFGVQAMGEGGGEERGDRLIHSTNISCLLCARHCFMAEVVEVIR